jgi:hypothetical protein
MNASLRPLLFAQMKAEHELAHTFTVPWISDRDPPGHGSYLTVCINADGAEYVAIHYWHNEWHSAGPFVRVVKWFWEPRI